MKIKVGLIGFGRMGRFYLKEMQKSGRWEVAYICDHQSRRRELAKQLSPESKILENEQEMFDDESVQVVGLFALADSRLDRIEKAIKYGKHIISEKPVSDTIDKEESMWTHRESQLFFYRQFVSPQRLVSSDYQTVYRSGRDRRTCHSANRHMTPGLAPGEGHEYEGPAFHDCGMHYVDIARWYAGCEYKTWHAQGVNMWSYKDPWWVQCHGTFQNGVVFDITQGFVYGQLSKDQTHNSYVDIIGTKGIARMTHDFKTAFVDLRGVTQTHHIEKPFGGKNIDVLCDLFADSIETGIRNPKLPLIRDSAIASEYAWTFLHDARTHDLPAIGELKTLEQIWERRRNMKNGYGLLRKP